MTLIRVVSELLQFLRPREHIKHQEQNIEQLKMKIKFLYYMRDALKEEIMKELVRGEMPRREFRIWLDKGERIEHQFNDILKAQKRGSVLNVSISAEQPKHLMSMLEYEIVKYLERSPFDHGPSSNSPRRIKKLRSRSKMYLSMKKSRKVKSQARTNEARAMPEDMMMPLEIVVHGNLVQQWKTKATAEAEVREFNTEVTTRTTLPSTPSKEGARADLISRAKCIGETAEAEPKQVKNEMTSNPTSPSSLDIQAAKVDLIPTVQSLVAAVEAELKEAKNGTAKEPTSPSSPSRQAAKADLDTSLEHNIAAAEPVSMEVKNEISSESTFKAAEKPQMVHTLKAKSDVLPAGGRGIGSCENRRLKSPEPRLNTKNSIQCMVQKVLRSKAKMIGIYGRGGIGKTSTLKVLIDDPKVKQRYDIIIWVTVSRCWSIRKIQDEIVRQLPFCLVDSWPDSNIARSLSQTLENEKFLLILDDVWEKIDLNEVGIPSSSLGNGCRLIMATRSVDVCRDMAAMEIEVGNLSAEEAWELFYEQVGQNVDAPDIQPYARGIVNECGGLPLTIIVTGKALARETDVAEWKLALKDFLLPKTGIHGIEPPIQQLKFSYERLKVHARKNPRLMGSNLQICFLRCSRFTEDCEVDTSSLVEYWIQEGLIAGNLADAHKKGYDIVEVLIEAALLESTRDGLCVKMHDTIRDLASGLLAAETEGCQFPVRLFPVQGSNPLSTLESIEVCNFSSPEDHEYLCRAGAGLTEPPLEKEWEVAKMISLEDNDLSRLPPRPNCPNLLTLSLQRNPRLRVLPVSFFDLMPHLKVLNMSKTRITSLPESILRLQNLLQLNLRYCECLINLPSEVGKLKHLELLDLHGTVLNKLPEAVGELESLKDLEVSFYGPVDHREYSELPSELISSGILSKLHHLNNLSIVVNPGDQRWNGITESIIRDICNLRNLTSLRFYFPKVGHLELFHHINYSWKHNLLKNFSFIVGHDTKRMLSRVPYDVELDYNQQDRCLRLVNEKMAPQEAIKQVLSHTTSFYLDHHHSISSLSQFGSGNIIGLEFCVVRECPEIEYIINGKELALPFLEHLSLHYLEKLKGIWNWKDQFPSGSFASLKCLRVHTCWQLEFVFTISMSRYLPNLEELAIEDCQAIKDVIFVQSPVKPDDIMLPKLKSLTLSYLPNLVSIWKGTWPSIEQMSFKSCPKLKNLNMGSGSRFRLSIKKIEAQKEWWDLLKWNDNSLYQELQTCFVPFPREDL